MSYLSDLLGEQYKEGMSVDELSAALEVAVPELMAAATKKVEAKWKGAVDKATAEAAARKRELREHNSQEQNQIADLTEQLNAATGKVAELERSAALNRHVTDYIKLGYEEKLAKATAKALVDGDFDTVTKNQQAFLSSYKDAIIADQMKHMSKPTGGTIGSVDYNKKIEEANAAGDVAAVAYYTRLAGQAAATE